MACWAVVVRVLAEGEAGGGDVGVHIYGEVLCA